MDRSACITARCILYVCYLLAPHQHCRELGEGNLTGAFYISQY